MLEIRISGVPMRLLPNTVMTLVQKNPIFSGGFQAEAYSLPITLPTTGNDLLLGFSSLPESGVNTLEFPCEVYCEGVLQCLGSFQIQQAGDATIQGVIVGTMFEKSFLEKKISELEYGGDRLVASDDATLRMHATATATGSVDTFDYVFFPIENRTFFNESTGIENEIVNAYVPGTGFAWNQITSSWDYPCMPFPYLRYVMERVASYGGMALFGDFFNDAELRTLTIYNTFSIRNIANWAINLKNHLPPDISIRTLIQGICGMFNAAAWRDKNGGLVLQKRQGLSQRAPAFDWTNKAAPSPQISYDAVHKQGYSLKMSVDTNDQVGKLLERGSTRYPSMTGVVANVAALPPLAIAGSVYFVLSDHCWYLKRYDLPSVYYKQMHYGFRPSLSVGDGKTVITTEVGTLPMVKQDKATVGPYPVGIWDGIFPHAKQHGNDIALVPEQENPYSLRFLFYRGMQPCNLVLPVGTSTYPLGSSDVWNYNGAQIGNYALQWDGANGLYERFYKDWLEMLANSKRVTWKLRLSAAELSLFDMTQKVRINGCNYFVEQLNIPLTSSGVGTVTAKCLQV